MADTRKLSPKAARLYAGAQQTKEGVKSLGRDQNAALMGLARYLGMFTDKTELSGPGGGPLKMQAVRAEDLSDDQLATYIAAASGATLGVSALNLSAGFNNRGESDRYLDSKVAPSSQRGRRRFSSITDNTSPTAPTASAPPSSMSHLSKDV